MGEDLTHWALQLGVQSQSVNGQQERRCVRTTRELDVAFGVWSKDQIGFHEARLARADPAQGAGC